MSVAIAQTVEQRILKNKMYFMRRNSLPLAQRVGLSRSIEDFGNKHPNGRRLLSSLPKSSTSL